MSAWQEAVEFAVRRSSRPDNGAQAALAGILGLPNPYTSETPLRCYNAAHDARQREQQARERRRKPPLEPGTTGNRQWDAKLTANMRQEVAV